MKAEEIRGFLARRPSRLCPAVAPSVLCVLSVLSVLSALSLAGAPAQPPADPAKAKQEEEQKLIAVLKAEAQPFEKDRACRRLAVIGSKEAVPAVAALLLDEKLCDVARIALEAIPDPAVDEALRAALGKVKGRLLAGVINSIGVRRDAKAVDDLVRLLGDTDPAVAGSAAGALGRIGGPAAAQALQEALAKAPAAVRPAIADGCLALADTLLVQGKRDEAAPIYDALRKADLPPHVLAAATRGAVLARETAGVPLLLEQLRSSEKERVRIALKLARELPGNEVTKALTAELGKLAPSRQVLLLQALGDRRDPAAVPAILEAAKAADPSVRAAAFRVLAQVGDASVVPLLMDAATGPDPDVAKAAQMTLAGFPATKAVDDALLAMVEKGDAKARRAAIELAGQRRIAAATPALFKAADDTDPAVRAAALKALGDTVAVTDLPALAARLAKAKGPQDAGPVEKALESACVRLPDKAACGEKLLAALPQAEGASKGALLRLLRLTGGVAALQAVRAALKDADPEIQDAAIRSLSKWPTADAAPDLAELARSAPKAVHRVLALRGYVGLISVGDTPADKKLAMCKEAMELAKHDDEKKAVLAGLGEVPHPEALKMVEACLGNPAVKAEAELALLSIAKGLAGSSRDEAKAALTKLTEESANASLRKQAKDALAQIDRFEDYVVAWQIAGPYSQEGKDYIELIDVVFPPEKADAKGVAWRAMPVATPPAKPTIIDLEKASGGGQLPCCVYVRTWVQSPQEQKARLEFGTDDGNKVWLNGQLVNTKREGGACVPGAHRVPVTLRQGWNTLLIKITQGAGPWELCFRIRKADGARLDGLRVQALPPAE